MYQMIPRVVEAFQYGVDDIPEWFDRMCENGMVGTTRYGTHYIHRSGLDKSHPSYKKIRSIKRGQFVVFDKVRKRVYTVDEADFKELYLDLDEHKVICPEGLNELIGW